ncbi:MAG: dynamin family protein [Chloroflexi bacterium]|nr:dynamin family protein [Chloroflexota bacterium]
MQAILSREQELLLKQTREVLGEVRELLASANVTDPHARQALAESIRQLDELFLLVVAGEFNAGKSSFINALLGKPGLLQEGVTPTTSQIYLLKYDAETTQAPSEKGVWVQTAPVDILRNINIVDTPARTPFCANMRRSRPILSPAPTSSSSSPRPTAPLAKANASFWSGLRRGAKKWCSSSTRLTSWKMRGSAKRWCNL